MADFRYYVMAKFYETARRERRDWDYEEAIYRVATSTSILRFESYQAAWSSM
jgi:hypothetical protein